MTVLSPAAGAVLDCEAPPEITWSAGTKTRFVVLVAWDPGFRPEHRMGSEGWMKGATSWTPEAHRWRRACSLAAGSLYVRVVGRDVSEPTSEWSRPVAVRAP